MPLSDRNSSDFRPFSKSRLTETLHRLQEQVEQMRDSERITAQLFETWQTRWSDRREQVSRRLELIDMQLEALVRSQQNRPQLSVVGEEH
jgi:uncharacterized protein YukE